MFGFPPAEPFAPTRWLDDGDTVQLGHSTLAVRHCPGHTPGHVVFHSTEAQRCFASKVDTYVNGEAPEATAACRSQQVLARLSRSGGDVLDAFLGAVTADDFFTRTP